MQGSTVTDVALPEQPPTSRDDPKLQAAYVAGVAQRYLRPASPSVADLKRFCKALGYPWRPVLIELKRSGVNLWRNVDVDVREQLARWLDRQIWLEATRTPGPLPLGYDLSEKGFPARDVRLPCGRPSCGVCSLRSRTRNTAKLRAYFSGLPTRAIILDPNEWDDFRTVELRDGPVRYHGYYRIPAPEGKLVIVTEADLGHPVDVWDIQLAIQLQPCDNRRIS